MKVVNKVIAVLLISSFIFLLTDVVSSQESLIFVDNNYFSKPQRVSSIFHHDIHNEKAEIDDCSSCHHVYDEKKQKVKDESSEDQSCSECHSNKMIAQKVTLRRAFHLTCKSCHKKRKKGPIGCGNCHCITNG